MDGGSVKKVKNDFRLTNINQEKLINKLIYVYASKILSC